MNVLVTGGAGYIGSHLLRALAAAGHNCVAYDSLEKGHPASVGDAPLVRADCADAAALAAAMEDHAVEAVIHLAAYIEAGESVADPGKYFRNNTVIGLTLLDAMRAAGVSRLVFSSTAAVYGNPASVPIDEDAAPAPISPYGSSKLCVEYMLRGYAAAHGVASASLRYFNVAGADPAGDIGEDHRPESHLIPLVLQVPLGRRDDVKIFGDDYDTPDGTCIRDYIHVCDLCDAHVLALDALAGGEAKAYNLGNGEGFSVEQVIETCREVTDRDIPAEVVDRRPGDPARLVASSQRAERELGWEPKYPYLKEIVSHAWQWHESHPDGFGD